MEAEFNKNAICEVSKDTVAQLKARARQSPRGRFRLCLHHNTDKLVNEMVIVANRGTYIRPHRHPQGRDESYYVMEGEMVVFFFDNTGRVFHHTVMGEYHSGKPSLYRLSESIWHLPVPTSDVAVYHEVFTGPFDKDRDVEYASWAPPESDVEAAASYMNQLMSLVGKERLL